MNEHQLKRLLTNLLNLADRLDSQLITRDDGKLESMYTHQSQDIRDNLHEAVMEAWNLLGETEEGL